MKCGGRPQVDSMCQGSDAGRFCFVKLHIDITGFPIRDFQSLTRTFISGDLGFDNGGLKSDNPELMFDPRAFLGKVLSKRLYERSE